MHVNGIHQASVTELQRAMSAGEYTAAQLTLYYLQRIGRYNHDGPAINAVIEVNPDALQIAEALDAERVSKGPRGPLHGIPVLVKDNIATADKMHTSAGSLALADSVAGADAHLVVRLRAAGCVLLGKTNLTEWANFMSDHMPNGYSSRGGQVLCPYSPGNFDVGGSSAGSGAGVAAGFAPLAVGTETSGSILSPASSNSVVGIKPTVGLISRSGVIPISHSQDTAGPMAKTVADAAVLLGALAGLDEGDPATRSANGRTLTDYTACLDSLGLRGARIGVVRDPYFTALDEEELPVMERALTDIRAAGAEIVEGLAFAALEDLRDYAVLVYEFKSDLNHYLRQLPALGQARSLTEVIAFNERFPEQSLRYGQSVLIEADSKSGTLTEREYIEARALDLRHSQTEGIDSLLAAHRLDALVFPANYGASIAAKAGYPSVCVPGGYTSTGKPFGITFTGSAFSEAVLLRLAYAYEQATRHRVEPRLEEN